MKPVWDAQLFYYFLVVLASSVDMKLHKYCHQLLQYIPSELASMPYLLKISKVGKMMPELAFVEGPGPVLVTEPVPILADAIYQMIPGRLTEIRANPAAWWG